MKSCSSAVIDIGGAFFKIEDSFSLGGSGTFFWLENDFVLVEVGGSYVLGRTCLNVPSGLKSGYSLEDIDGYGFDFSLDIFRADENGGGYMAFCQNGIDFFFICELVKNIEFK